MEKLSRLLAQPEYVHVTINHFPLVGLPVAMLALAAGLAVRNRVSVRIGLALVALVSLTIWPVYAYGEAGYDRVLSMTDEAGSAYLQLHQDMAKSWAFLYFITSGIAALGFGLSWKWPKSLTLFGVLVLLLSAGSLVAGIAIAQAGGEIRHREFRFGPPPARHEQQ